MKKLLIFLPVLLILLFPVAAAADSYNPNQEISIFTTVKNITGDAVSDATVTLDIYNPDNILIVNGTSMSHITDGVYQYNWTVTEALGTYFCVATATGYGYDSMSFDVVEAFSANISANVTVDYAAIWGYNISGLNGTTSAGGIINEALGGNMVNIITIGVLSLIAGLFIVLYILKREIWLSIVACIAWLLFGVFNVSISSGANPTQIVDIWMGLAWVGFAVAIVCTIVTFAWKKKEITWRESEDEYEGEPIMVKFVNGMATTQTRPLTDLEFIERTKRLKAEEEERKERKASRGGGKESDFATKGQL